VLVLAGVFDLLSGAPITHGGMLIAAELAPAEEHRIGHRGRALRALRELLTHTDP
jgi:inosine/xanthosine triphosphate pyrophosphatase family protein